MVSLELFEPLPNDPESRLPNASPEVVVDAPLLAPRAEEAAVDDGVRERGLDEFEPEAASIEKASYFGRMGALLDDGVGLAPSLRGGCDGFTGAEEFQRSAKESAMATDHAGLHRSYVFSLAFLTRARGSEVVVMGLDSGAQSYKHHISAQRQWLALTLAGRGSLLAGRPTRQSQRVMCCTTTT